MANNLRFVRDMLPVLKDMTDQEVVSLLSASLPEQKVRAIYDWADLIGRIRETKGEARKKASLAAKQASETIAPVFEELKKSLAGEIKTENLGVDAREAIETTQEKISGSAPPTTTATTAAPKPSSTGEKPTKISLKQFKDYVETLEKHGLEVTPDKFSHLRIRELPESVQAEFIANVVKERAAVKAATTPEPAPPKEPPKTISKKEVLARDLPKERKGVASLLKELKKAGGRTEARTLAKVANIAGPENLNFKTAESALEGIQAGRLQDKGSILQTLMKWGGSATESSKRFQGEQKIIEAAQSMSSEKAAAAGLSKFAKETASLKNVLKEGMGWRGVVPLALLALTVRSALANRKEPKDVTIEGASALQTASELRRRLDTEREIMQRRVQLESNPVLARDVVRILAGENVDRGITGSEIQIGNITRGRKPVETEQLMNVLLGRLATKGSSPYSSMAESMMESE